MAAVAGVVAAAAAVAQRRAEQAAAQASSVDVFRRYAARWNLEVEVKQAAGAPAPRMSGTIAGIGCAFDIATDADGWAHTQVIAQARIAGDATITAYPNPNGIFRSLKRALFGTEEDALGDSSFDEHFLVHASPRQGVETLLDAEMRATLKVWLAHHLEAFVYERGRVALQWRGVELDPAVLDAGFALVARAAEWRPPHPEAIYR